MKPRIPPHRRHAYAWLLVAALLFAQTLGLAHLVLHAPGVAGGDALFGQHDGNDCRLYDQLAHGDALAVALPALPPVLPDSAPLAETRAGVEHACAAVYSARAPPRA